MRDLRRLSAIALTVVLIANDCASWCIAAPEVRTEDRNGDGRPDVWKWYAADRQLVRIDVDNNFDGRPDERDRYTHDALSRREIDVNFDGQFDIVADLNPLSGEIVREIADTDLDGCADLLRLFQADRVALTKRTNLCEHRANVAGRLTQELEDPFLKDLAIRTANPAAQIAIGVPASPDISLDPGVALSGVRCSTVVVSPAVSPAISSATGATRLRGPPLFSSL